MTTASVVRSVGKLFVLFALFVVGVTSAQTATNTIPDQVIFRVWLNNMTSNGQIQSTTGIGLNSTDNQALQLAMQSYQTAYQSLVTAHNAKTDVAADQKAFWNSLLALTSNTFTGLQASMSQAGFQLFDAFLQILKTAPGTTISPYDPGLGVSAAQLHKETHMMAGMPQTGGMTPEYSSIATTVISGGSLMDDFAGEANGALPSSEWTAASGSFTMSSGQLSVTANGSKGLAAAYFNGGGTVTNYQGQCSGTYVGSTVPSGLYGRYPAGAVRMSTDGNTFYTGFYGTGQIAVWKFINGTPSWVVPNGSYLYTAQTGDYIQICAEGTSITVNLINAAGTVAGEIMSASDSSISTGYPGIWGQAPQSGSTNGTAEFWQGYTQSAMQETIGTSGDSACPLGCPAGAYHYASVTNTNGSVGVTNYESGHVTPTTYIDWYWTQSYSWDELLGQAPPNLTVGNFVYCSGLARIIFAGPAGGANVPEQPETAITFVSKSGGIAGGSTTVNQQCTTWSMNPVQYPDFNPTDLYWTNGNLFDAPYFKMKAFCWRYVFSGSYSQWTCQQTGYIPYNSEDEAKEQFRKYGNGNYYNCTYTSGATAGVPYNGLPYP